MPLDRYFVAQKADKQVPVKDDCLIVEFKSVTSFQHGAMVSHHERRSSKAHTCLLSAFMWEIERPPVLTNQEVFINGTCEMPTLAIWHGDVSEAEK